MNDVVNPVKSGQETPRVREALRQASAHVGLDPRDAQLLHHYANAVYLLPAENVVARVMFGPQSAHKATLSVTVTRWLVSEHRFPATAPIHDIEPVMVDPSTTATFWTHYPQPISSHKLTSAHLGPLIRRLHALPQPPTRLPSWVPLRSLEHTVRSPAALAVITAADRDWLLRHIDEVRRNLDALDWPLGWGLIHGDAWAGNLLWHSAAGPDATVLGDWDSVCHGPREIDLIPSFHAARRYGRGPNGPKPSPTPTATTSLRGPDSPPYSLCATSSSSAHPCDEHPTNPPSPVRSTSESKELRAMARPRGPSSD